MQASLKSSPRKININFFPVCELHIFSSIFQNISVIFNFEKPETRKPKTGFQLDSRGPGGDPFRLRPTLKPCLNSVSPPARRANAEQ